MTIVDDKSIAVPPLKYRIAADVSYELVRDNDTFSHIFTNPMVVKTLIIEGKDGHIISSFRDSLGTRYALKLDDCSNEQRQQFSTLGDVGTYKVGSKLLVDIGFTRIDKEKESAKVFIVGRELRQ